MYTIIQRPTEDSGTDLSGSLHPILERIYRARGVKAATELEYGLERLATYHDLLNIDAVVTRLATAIRLQQRILVVGDFDADGATSTALVVHALRRMGAKRVHFLVPNRFEFGYGLTPEIVAFASHDEPNLIITVDNGISSVAGVQAANDRGIDVIITDHHLPGDTLPNAVAIVNPNQPGDLFPCKNLAGVGVAFYVMLALRSHLQEAGWFEEQQIARPVMAQYLDLVALGTIADVVPLDYYNRVLVYQGLQRIRQGKSRFGIYALLDVAGRRKENLIASDLAFAIGPRLNAAGRLDDMALGIECLLAETYDQAFDMATMLDELNQERRVIERDMQRQANEILDNLGFSQGDETLPAALCLFDESWHQGVIGLLASRVKDKMHRPVIVFALNEDGTLKGSARSVPGLHIRDVLDAIAKRHEGVIEKFGGHAMAAGLSIAREHLTAFATAFAQEVERARGKVGLTKTIYTDGSLRDTDFTLDFALLLRDSGPWGQAFPEPLFYDTFQVLEQRIVGSKHLKLLVRPEAGFQPIDAIVFYVNQTEWPNYQVERIEAAYRMGVNSYKGRESLQLVFEAFSPITVANGQAVTEGSAIDLQEEPETALA